MNCVPVTVSTNAGPPTVALDGESDVVVGAGFGGVLIAKLIALDVPPPGEDVCTVTLAFPVVLKSDAGTCAVREVPDT
jgi:hypothetical protein